MVPSNECPELKEYNIGTGLPSPFDDTDFPMFSQSYAPVKFERDAEVALIPEGQMVELPAGTTGYLTQSLGGSFTIYVDGRLFRLAGEDADAIGREPQPRPELPEDASDQDLEELVLKQLKTCYDPEIPINIVDLGLIYKVDVSDDGVVDIDMTLTSMGCPVQDMIQADAELAAMKVEGVRRVNVEFVWSPPWSTDKMSDDGKKQMRMMGFNV